MLYMYISNYMYYGIWSFVEFQIIKKNIKKNEYANVQFIIMHVAANT